MVDRERIIERRKDKRYKTVEGAYAAIGPNSQKLGQILDISIGGVCFKYINISNEDQDAGIQQENLISLRSMGYSVGNLPFKTVADYEVTNMPSFSLMRIRKRHAQFTDLSSKRLFDLDYYIRNNVLDSAEKSLE